MAIMPSHKYAAFVLVFPIVMVATAGTVLAHDLIFMNGFGVSATISHPSDGASYIAGNSIAFIGSASPSSTLAWASNIDGPIGSGTSFSASLSAGYHTITLTANATGYNEVSKVQIDLQVTP